jgi:uncharacterized protein (DUF1697 family)
VVFEGKGGASHWTAQLERKLDGATRLPVSIMVRTAAEIAAVAAGNPFLKEKGIDVARLAVMFLQQAPTKDAIVKLHALDIGSERFQIAGREIYLHCPDGFAKAKLYLLDKILGQKTTVRNWTTVLTLHEIAGE